MGVTLLEKQEFAVGEGGDGSAAKRSSPCTHAVIVDVVCNSAPGNPSPLLTSMGLRYTRGAQTHMQAKNSNTEK